MRGLSGEKMDEIESVVLKYLESRDNGWKWIKGAKVYTKEETVKLFKKDKKFRKLIVEEVYKLAVDIFMRSSKKK